MRAPISAPRPPLQPLSGFLRWCLGAVLFCRKNPCGGLDKRRSAIPPVPPTADRPATPRHTRVPVPYSGEPLNVATRASEWLNPAVSEWMPHPLAAPMVANARDMRRGEGRLVLCCNVHASAPVTVPFAPRKVPQADHARRHRRTTRGARRADHARGEARRHEGRHKRTTQGARRAGHARGEARCHDRTTLGTPPGRARRAG